MTSNSTAIFFHEKHLEELAYSTIFYREAAHTAKSWLAVECFKALDNNIDPQPSIPVMRAMNYLNAARRRSKKGEADCEGARIRLAELNNGEIK